MPNELMILICDVSAPNTTASFLELISSVSFSQY